MKINIMLILLLFSMAGIADLAKFSAVVISDDNQMPIEGVQMQANFWENNGWKAWTQAPRVDVDSQTTDKNGFCRFKGKTNCGNVCCFVSTPPKGFYAGDSWGTDFKKKNIFGVWQPDNLVVTLRLQRVEHPIPLFVKKVCLKNHEKGIGNFDGTNSVVKFDLVEGDWLPPYGEGKVADLEIKSTVGITDKERKFRHATRRVEDVFFYNLETTVSTCSTNDTISRRETEKYAGIKIRTANEDSFSRQIVRRMGMRKKTRLNFPAEWYCEYFSDYSKDLCCQFRVRTNYDEKGNLKEAYYGKIYGDFEIEGDEKKGLVGISFLYYLNPKPLDRNLEWDMKNNLCPNPGDLSQPMP